MHKKIGTQLHAATGAFSAPADSPARMMALNLCMAPGGYTSTILEVNPSAYVKGITLSEESGGHTMPLPFGNEDSRVDVKFMDITMLASEYGPSNANIPLAHPEAGEFAEDSPYQGITFDIVVCDGQNLRTHKRAACRNNQEALRLMLSQLIFGMNRIRAGGTLVILLHQLGSWNSVKLLRAFDSFSSVQLFKPLGFHQDRSSFYLVAKDVQPGAPEAIKSIEQWRFEWWQTTFGGVESTGKSVEDDSKLVNSVLESFGQKFMELGRDIWKIRLEAMKGASYVNNT